MSAESRELRRFIENTLHRDLMGQPVWVWGVGVIALMILVRVIAFFQSKRDRTAKHYRKVVCAECGWKGKTSGQRAQCPRCRSTNFG